MSNARKIVEKILEGRADTNISFADLCHVLLRAGFSQRAGKGSHRIFYRDGIPEIVNVQPRGNLAKPYQVKQVRNLLVRYKLQVK